MYHCRTRSLKTGAYSAINTPTNNNPCQPNGFRVCHKVEDLEALLSPNSIWPAGWWIGAVLIALVPASATVSHSLLWYPSQVPLWCVQLFGRERNLAY